MTEPNAMRLDSKATTADRRDRQLAMLEIIMEALLVEVRLGNGPAIDRMLKAMEREAKLTPGLESKDDTTVSAGAPAGTVEGKREAALAYLDGVRADLPVVP